MWANLRVAVTALQFPDSTPYLSTPFGSRGGDTDDYDPYADIAPEQPAASEEKKAPEQPAEPTPEDERPRGARATYQSLQALPADAQDSYFETREPSELIFCIILAAAYAGLARFCWEPLQASHQWFYFVCVEGFFITVGLLSLVLGIRPYLSPSSLQISKHGLKYRGPYWPQRKTVNWQQIFQLYLSPELIIIFYRPPTNPKGVRLLIIQSSYLSDRKAIVDSFAKYCLVQPVYMKNPDWYIKAIFLMGYLAIVCWILWMLQQGTTTIVPTV
jgi:hypothetical protein